MPQIQQAGGSSSSSSSSSQSGANASQQRQRQQQQQRDPEKVEIKGAKNSQMPDGGSENNVGDEDDEEEQKYRLKPEDLQKLERSARVKGLLMNPNIRALMNQVRKDASPAEAVRVLRQRSAEFEELVQAFIQATE
ncbi:hypothetical protein GGI12_001642 [Dipsacomyces acuminosporus]|nr:hypothetical protein GGI12_001642 [Dipsacomyces acuminosporus]